MFFRELPGNGVPGARIAYFANLVSLRQMKRIQPERETFSSSRIRKLSRIGYPTSARGEGVYLIVLGSFILWVALLIALTEIFS